jgi:biotin operon repressor
MCKRERPKRMTRPAYMLLAALLLADGDWVSRRDLADGLFIWPIRATTISAHAWTCDRRAGVFVERRYGRGYRLRTLPPDEHLDGMLACVPAVKRSAWWRARRDRELMTA